MDGFSSYSNTVFHPKTWYLYPAAIVFTTLAIFCAVLGPLFLVGIIQKADGKPGNEAGAIMSTIAVPLSLLAFLGWGNVYARRKPVLRICREGLAANIIGAQSLGDVTLTPAGIIRVAELIVSRRGIEAAGWIPWETFRAVSVEGLPMQRSLVIDATIVYSGFGDPRLTAKVVERIVFPDAEFQVPLETVAWAILVFYENPEARQSLPSYTTEDETPH